MELFHPTCTWFLGPLWMEKKWCFRSPQYEENPPQEVSASFLNATFLNAITKNVFQSKKKQRAENSCYNRINPNYPDLSGRYHFWRGTGWCGWQENWKVFRKWTFFISYVLCTTFSRGFHGGSSGQFKTCVICATYAANVTYATYVMYVTDATDVLPWLEPFINPCNIDL